MRRNPYRRENSYRSRKRKGPPAALLTLMLAVFLSMLLAGIWQLLDPVPYTPLQPMGSVRYADGGSVPPSQQKQVTPQVSVSAEPQPAEPVQEESVEAEPGKESLSTVAEGSWAPSSYFDDAVFFGDSLTDGIKLYDVMNNATVISHTGINLTNIFTREVISQSSGGKVTMLDALQKQNPKKVYILLGANSMGMEKGMFLSAYRRLVKEVVARTNGATIYVQSILPVTHTYETNRPEFANSVIDEYNAGLRQMAIEEGVEYLDVAEAFKNENNALPEEMSTDGMHFGTAGYQKWFAYLRVHTA